ncbi:DegT/DnrJ/EryC1/StrS family aminotransferase [Bradyrhizobium sp. UFLA06-06]
MMTIQCTPASETVGSALQVEDLRRQIHQLVEHHCALTHGWKLSAANYSSAPVSGRVFDNTNVHQADAAVEFWLTAGHFNSEFQAKLAQRVALAVHSGSSTNLVVFSALTSPLLGERILQPGSQSHGSNRISNDRQSHHAVGDGAVLIDIDIPTCNVTPEFVEAPITPQTQLSWRLTHLGIRSMLRGLPRLPSGITSFSSKTAAARLAQRSTAGMWGTFGEIGTLSLYPAQHITMGDGGLCQPSRIGEAMETFRDGAATAPFLREKRARA